jgi:hypothetical protein
MTSATPPEHTVAGPGTVPPHAADPSHPTGADPWPQAPLHSTGYPMLVEGTSGERGSQVADMTPTLAAGSTPAGALPPTRVGPPAHTWADGAPTAAPVGPTQPGAGHPTVVGPGAGHPTVGPTGGPGRPPLIRWPRPRHGADPSVLVGIVLAAAFGAGSVPVSRPGVGWLAAALAATGALTLAAVAANRGQGTPEASPAPTAGWGRQGAPAAAPVPAGLRPGRLAWAATTVALIGVGTVRAAGWLFVLCLVAAGVSALMALTDGRSVRAMLLSAVLPPVAVLRSVPWAVRSAREQDARAGLTAARVLVSALVSVVLLLVFWGLFASADLAFAELFGNVVPDLTIRAVIRWPVIFVLLVPALLGAAFLLTTSPRVGRLDERHGHRFRQLEWAVPVALLDLLFAAFVMVQVAVLFGGSELVLRTAGLTYAGYARSGFWQLLAVSALALLVIGVVGRWAPRETARDRTLLRGLLGVLCVFSLVVVASAVFRLSVYTQAYGATRMRLLVGTFEVWLGLVFLLVMVAGVRLRAARLPRLVIGTAVAALLLLAVANPDRLIAESNVDRFARTGKIDVAYLNGLSADAVPTLDRLPDPYRRCALLDNARAVHDPLDWRSLNLGRSQARRITEMDPALLAEDRRCAAIPRR